MTTGFSHSFEQRLADLERDAIERMRRAARLRQEQQETTREAERLHAWGQRTTPRPRSGDA